MMNISWSVLGDFLVQTLEEVLIQMLELITEHTSVVEIQVFFFFFKRLFIFNILFLCKLIENLDLDHSSIMFYLLNI